MGVTLAGTKLRTVNRMVKVHVNKTTFYSISARSFTVDRPVGWQMKILLVFQKAMLRVFKCSYSTVKIVPTLKFLLSILKTHILEAVHSMMIPTIKYTLAYSDMAMLKHILQYICKAAE